MRFGRGCFTEDDVLVMTRPQCRDRMCGRHKRVSLIADIRFRLNADCQSSSSSVSKTPGFGPPALLNKIPMDLKSSRVTFTTRSRSASRVTSAESPTTRAPSAATPRTSSAAVLMSSGSRENMTTLAPSCASAMAAPLPSPLLAAATIAVFPRSPRSIAAERTKRSAEHSALRLIERLVVEVVVVHDPQIRLRLCERDLFHQHVWIVAEALQPARYVAAAGVVGRQRGEDPTFVFAQQLGQEPSTELHADRRLEQIGQGEIVAT